MSLALPSLSAPAVDSGGFFSTAWIGFLSRLLRAPGALATVVVGPSPFTFRAADNGSLALIGGTVTGLTITRARITAAVAGTLIPVSNGDLVTVTYSAAPTMTFIPRTL